MISPSQRPLPDNTQQTNIHAPGEIRTHGRSRRAAVDLRLRPCSYWDRQREHMYIFIVTRCNDANCHVSFKREIRGWCWRSVVLARRNTCRGATRFRLAPTLYNLCISVAQTTRAARLAVFAHDNCMHGTSRKERYVLSCKSVWHRGSWNEATAQQGSPHHSYLHIAHAYSRIICGV